MVSSPPGLMQVAAIVASGASGLRQVIQHVDHAARRRRGRAVRNRAEIVQIGDYGFAWLDRFDQLIVNDGVWLNEPKAAELSRLLHDLGQIALIRADLNIVAPPDTRVSASAGDNCAACWPAT